MNQRKDAGDGKAIGRAGVTELRTLWFISNKEFQDEPGGDGRGGVNSIGDAYSVSRMAVVV